MSLKLGQGRSLQADVIPWVNQEEGGTLTLGSGAVEATSHADRPLSPSLAPSQTKHQHIGLTFTPPPADTLGSPP